MSGRRSKFPFSKSGAASGGAVGAIIALLLNWYGIDLSGEQAPTRAPDPEPALYFEYIIQGQLGSQAIYRSFTDTLPASDLPKEVIRIFHEENEGWNFDELLYKGPVYPVE